MTCDDCNGRMTKRLPHLGEGYDCQFCLLRQSNRRVLAELDSLDKAITVRLNTLEKSISHLLPEQGMILVAHRDAPKTTEE